MSAGPIVLLVVLIRLFNSETRLHHVVKSIEVIVGRARKSLDLVAYVTRVEIANNCLQTDLGQTSKFDLDTSCSNHVLIVVLIQLLNSRTRLDHVLKQAEVAQ